ncbi:hypothetical protein [Methylobacterium sp. Leaf118]|uniref:hypothetical protein n=1 Tax=Methylobacterium sp. Leaf118 TaxID=2876562 RepID=UPI001E4C3074|nr:hypothetical protein [Methylobacterium sp. Leaf118]
MIALLVLAAAIAQTTLVVMLAERFGGVGQVSAGEMTRLQGPSPVAATRSAVLPANENAFATRARRAA